MADTDRHAAPMRADDLPPGTMLDGTYRIASQLGSGGMGAVYLAEHVALGRRFAIKVVLPHRGDDPNTVQRLRQEARAASSVRHPNIVDVTHLGTTADGLVYVVMELLEGETLAARMLRARVAAGGVAPLPDAEALRIVSEVLAGLAHAHDAGIVHRDLKPENIFLVRNDDGPPTVKIVDFGLSKLRARQDDIGLTQSGQILGTPLYMAPEQGRSTADVDARADLYSVGCIMYELVTGRVPFAATSLYECIALHATKPADPPSRHRLGLSPALDALITSALEKQPSRRPKDARVMRDAWESAWRTAMSRPVGARRSRLTLAGVVAGAVGISAFGLGSLELDGGGRTSIDRPSDAPRDHAGDIALTSSASANEPAAAEPGAVSIDAAAARVRTIHVVSRPAGAHVRLGDRIVGVTPRDVDVPPDENLEIVLEAEGYMASTVELDRNSPPVIDVELSAAPAAERRSGAAAARSRDEPPRRRTAPALAPR